MNGRTGNFGSIGAVSGIKNPIRLARCVLDNSTKADKLGRVPPLTLVAEGARSFADMYMKKNQLIPPERLVTDEAISRWKKWKQRLETTGDVSSNSKYEEVVENASHNDLQDTVGAVTWHSRDGIAAGVSSGGILLKLPGRIGEAAVYGAGCWAQEAPKRAMACSISGTGEYIIRANLAQRIGDLFRNAWRNDSEEIDPHEILNRVVVNEFWHPARQKGEPEPSVGILLLTKEDDNGGITKVRLWCAFTTRSMAIAYASSENPKPKAMILRRPNQLHSAEVPVFITAITL
ncbi:nucleophile aminohydrolase [Cyathus striatus]|nr:nucleophile aminohydrolase [Cyathus striatus]